ncbi:glycosyltransferase [Candidatus Woesearchaeota archaeon]|nr:glycosyltransferase [Candidatus Woesearchaeota archaeon]
MKPSPPEITVLIPTLNEEENIGKLINVINSILTKEKMLYEIIIVDGNSTDNTVKLAKEKGATTILQTEKGFGNALIQGFEQARGTYTLTLDADFSHNPETIPQFLKERKTADIIIGSRYVKGGKFKISLSRKVISIFANKTFSLLLRVPIKDLSGNYRLYKTEILGKINPECEHYDILQEIAVKSYKQGFKTKEIPITYIFRTKGNSKLIVRKYLKQYIKTFIKLWRM